MGFLNILNIATRITAARTSDNSFLILWLILMAAALVIAVILLKGKK